MFFRQENLLRRRRPAEPIWRRLSIRRQIARLRRPRPASHKCRRPITPSSLISPPMNAIVLPSGDHRTLATCSRPVSECAAPRPTPRRSRTAPRCTNCRRHRPARPDTPDSCRPATSRTRTRTCPPAKSDRAAPVPTFTIARRCSTIFERSRPYPAPSLPWVPARGCCLRSGAPRCSFRPATNAAARHIALEFPILRGLPCPGFSTTYNCICPCESASERNASLPSCDHAKPCAIGRRIADAFGAGARIAQVFDVDGKARRLALDLARRRFDPSHLAAVRRNRYFAKVMLSEKRIQRGIERRWRSRSRRHATEQAAGKNDGAQLTVV